MRGLIRSCLVLERVEKIRCLAVVLVGKLLDRWFVGPATNIGTDYHLVESAGIVPVDPNTPRPYLRLVKEDIVRDALGWLRQIYGGDETLPQATLRLTNTPGTFVTPNKIRMASASTWPTRDPE